MFQLCSVFRYKLAALIRKKMWRKSFVTHKLYNLLSKKYDRYIEKNRLNVYVACFRHCDASVMKKRIEKSQLPGPPFWIHSYQVNLTPLSRSPETRRLRSCGQIADLSRQRLCALLYRIYVSIVLSSLKTFPRHGSISLVERAV